MTIEHLPEGDLRTGQTCSCRNALCTWSLALAAEREAGQRMAAAETAHAVEEAVSEALSAHFAGRIDDAPAESRTVKQRRGSHAEERPGFFERLLGGWG